jgi:hypothetical protein
MSTENERMRKQDFIRLLSPDVLEIKVHRLGQSHGLRHDISDEKIHSPWVTVALGGAKTLCETGTSCGHTTVKRLASDRFY